MGEAIAVGFDLARALAVWVVAAGMGLTVLLLLSAWAATSCTRAAWRGVTGAWRRWDAPKVNDCHSDTDKPAERRTAPRWKEAA